MQLLRRIPLFVITVFCMALPKLTDATPFLDVFLRVQPVEDFCGAQKCNVTYAISVLKTQNHFDLHSIMLQDGKMSRQFNNYTKRYFFEENTVIRLSNELQSTTGKLYLGIMFFDLPDDIQDYVVVEVSNVIQKGRRAKVEFMSETVSFGVQVFRRNEAILTERRPTKHRHQQLQKTVADHERNDSTTSLAVDYEHSPIRMLSQDSVESQHGHHHHSHHHHHQHRAQSQHNRQHGHGHHGHGDIDGQQNGCNCITRNCGCCEHVVIRKIHLDDNVCVNVSYISADIGLRLALSVNNHIYYSEEISLVNPPPVCFEVPHLREYASLCVRLYNLRVREKVVYGCSEVEAELLHVRVARHKIGCFQIPI